MDITEKWLGEIGGWAAMKSARSLVAGGSVSECTRDGDTLTGIVRSGKARYRAGLRVRSRADVDNICTCPVARRGGMICEHSLAVALMATGSTPPSVPVARPESVSSAAPGPQPGCPSGQFTLFLPDDLMEARRKEKTHVFLRFEPGGAERETALCLWLAGHGLKCQTMPLALADADLDGLLSAIGSHPRVFAGKPPSVGGATSRRQVTVAPDPVRLPVVVRERDGLSIRVELRNDKIVSLSSRTGGDGGTTWWWFCPETQTLFRTEKASGEMSALLAGIARPETQEPRDLSWFVRHVDEIEALFDLNLVGETLSNLKILPVPCAFALSVDGSSQFVEVELRARFSGADWLVAPEAGRGQFPIQDEKARNIFYVRDLVKEKSASRMLEQAGFEPAGAGRWRLEGARGVLHFYGSVMSRLREDFEVIEMDRWSAATRSWMRITPSIKPKPGDFQEKGATNHGDWLSLDIAYEASSGFRISRNEVMQMIRTGRRDLQDGKGRRYVLDADSCEEFEESLRDVDVQLTESGARVRSQFTEYLTGTDLAAAGWLEPALTSKEARAQLGAFGESLRDYQMDGVVWMERHGRMRRGALLADDMGLGKTIQTIATVQLLPEPDATSPAPVLIVCPKSLIPNWEAEIQRFAPRLKVASWVGSDRKTGADALWKSNVMLTTYQLVARDIDEFVSRAFRAIVIDEASYIRNPDTAAAKALRQLKAGARFALTGTPIENCVGDLWSIFQFLQPGYLGTREAFRERFEKPISDHPGSSEAAASSKRLKRLISPYVLRRTKAEVLSELPEKIEQVLWCDLTPAQAEVYRRVLDEGLEEIRQARKRAGDNGARMTMFTVLLRLRQICCDLRLSGLPQSVLDRLAADEFSGKAATLGDRVSEIAACNGKVLIFSQFVQFLRLIRSQIEGLNLGYSYLDGSTQDRATAVRRFQTDPQCRVFLVSLKAGGYGLNLTGANHVVLMDPWWNPAVEAQAIDRAHRMGQNRAVTALRMVTQGTVEERILKLQARKRGLIEVLVDEGGAGGGLSADELSELIGGAS